MQRSGPLLTIRAALLLFIAIFVGILVAALSQWAGQPEAATVLAGITASGSSLLALDHLIA
jgi:hypothetical protein